VAAIAPGDRVAMPTTPAARKPVFTHGMTECKPHASPQAVTRGRRKVTI